MALVGNQAVQQKYQPLQTTPTPLVKPLSATQANAAPKTVSQTTTIPSVQPMSAEQAKSMYGTSPVYSTPSYPTTPSYSSTPSYPTTPLPSTQPTSSDAAKAMYGTSPVYQGMSAAQAASGTPQTNYGIPPIYNAANPGGVKPELGYGGVSYGTSKEANKAISANAALIKTDAGRQSEIERSKAVIANVTKALESDPNNMELQKRLADANKYLTKNLGYIEPRNDEVQQPEFGMPQQDWKAMAEAEFAARMAQLRSQADSQIAGLTDSWNQSNKTLQDNRTLDNLFFQRNNSPFEGRTTYREAVLGREREQQDSASLNQFNSQIGAINQGYSDAQSNMQGQIAARAQQLENEAIQRAMQEAGLTGVYNGSQTLAAQNQTFNQNLDTAKFNLSATQAQIQSGQWDKQFELEMTKWAQQNNLDWATLSLNTKKAYAAIAVDQQNANTSRMNANTSAGSLAWSKDPNNPDNIYKNAQVDQLGKPDLNKVFDQLSSLYVSKDPNTDAPAITNATALRSAIVGMGMSDSDTDTMLLKFGLRPN